MARLKRNTSHSMLAADAIRITSIILMLASGNDPWAQLSMILAYLQKELNAQRKEQICSERAWK